MPGKRAAKTNPRRFIITPLKIVSYKVQDAGPLGIFITVRWNLAFGQQPLLNPLRWRLWDGPIPYLPNQAQWESPASRAQIGVLPPGSTPPFFIQYVGPPPTHVTGDGQQMEAFISPPLFFP